MKIYDSNNRRIVVLERKATPDFWDIHWQIGDIDKEIKAGENNRFIKKNTAKFLKPGKRILEGGCGVGQNVYGLKSWGYDAYGVDFAEKTIKKAKEIFPELKLFVQDVRKLDFSDNFFDGYWSLGVIEHFWKGYNEFLKEAKRIIKPGGYLFLTFPYMSLLRNVKAKLGFYEIFENNSKTDNFYQFILNTEIVKKDLEKYGFELVLKHPFDATKGLKDEVFLLKPIFQKIYESKNIIAKGIKFLNSALFSKIAGHTILLIFQKNEK